MAKLTEWSEGQVPLTITRLQAMAFVRAMGERHAPGGVALFARSLRAFYSWALAEGFVQSNPFAKMRISVAEVARRTAAPAGSVPGQAEDVDAVEGAGASDGAGAASDPVGASLLGGVTLAGPVVP